jgi:hypothetical protein
VIGYIRLAACFEFFILLQDKYVSFKTRSIYDILANEILNFSKLTYLKKHHEGVTKRV